MTTFTYYIIAGAVTVAILYGLHLMNNVKTSVRGNLICAAAMAVAIITTILRDASFFSPTIWIGIAAGTAVGLYLSNNVKMIQMPQLVAFLHGIGGCTAAIVGFLELVDSGATSTFTRLSASLALTTGMVAIAGSFIAAAKLHQLLPQKPVVLPSHTKIVNGLIAAMVASVLIHTVAPEFLPSFLILIMFLSGTFFGTAFTIRVGGADMPITISLLNSLSGVSAAIAGFAVGDPLLVAIGGIIGSAGLLLTRIMCKAMNRKLLSILLAEASGPTRAPSAAPKAAPAAAPAKAPAQPGGASQEAATAQLLSTARNVIIVPGYGMALAQAQHKVKQLADTLEGNGAKVQYAIHPVAGRMPGHMNVLLAEANVDYEQMLEMDVANPLFPQADLVIIIGANDVVNPAANTAEGTPIYGMPILNADQAKNVIICNFDEKPGYAGVNNPLYTKAGVTMMLGDAAATVTTLIGYASGKAPAAPAAATQDAGADVSGLLQNAKNVIIVPGYGMALAQAQYKVKQLADTLEGKGAKVQYAIHPVAGRMPGHMNVLLAEANVDYEQMLEMDVANPLFPQADLVIIIGANDVVNPAANTAEGTPIYGMPILNADQAKNVIICNFDEKPGYAGVDNPLYTKAGVTMMLGDAAATVTTLIGHASGTAPAAAPAAAAQDAGVDVPGLLQNAKNVIIVPGYGMALAQAQYKVKQLADTLEGKGAKVQYAIHPVAGRMPGHMNVLLAEANVDYEHMLEMDVANPLFPQADLVIIIGANDVVNPAANTAEGTPIYGMPILNADQAKNVIICNFDEKPGYAGVDNPLYTKAGVTMMLGDAAATVEKLIGLAQ